MSLLSRDTNSNLYGYIHAIVVYSVSKIDNADDEAIDVEEGRERLKRNKECIKSTITTTKPWLTQQERQ